MTNASDSASQSTHVADEWLAKSQAHRENADRLRPANKAALFDALAAASVTHVIVAFDGYGDEGQVESIEAKIGDAAAPLPDVRIELALPVWGQDEPERKTVALATAIEDLAYDCLAQTHDGWENSDGAFGDFLFDVGARTVTLDYHERFTDHTSSSHTF